MPRYKIDCCLDCSQRHPGCHSTCANYRQQRAEYDETMAEVRRKHDLTAGLNGFLFDSIERTNRGLHRKGR